MVRRGAGVRGWIKNTPILESENKHIIEGSMEGAGIWGSHPPFSKRK